MPTRALDIVLPKFKAAPVSCVHGSVAFTLKKKLTSEKTARDPNSRINKSLRAWNC